ncbi:hypothetical protein DJ568_14375 [Mucilaginibacter hurinus]|uniref:Uncharacterized protein n=1 Tax=Mucilaginibacter hurinus TaxID=2201324 RepID=A0A367GKR2_9SPHI|nr:hypothetical protein [Mucilaginibacter hurinus]RCH54067.1 hypothetical protein DJ568_14375 [Mucilaginibacter hurinus]
MEIEITQIIATKYYHMAMSTTTKFILNLSFLVIPFAVLCVVLHEDDINGSIGGGSYDLSGLVYGLLLFAFIIIWLIWILICYFNSKSAVNRKLYGALLVIGLLTLIAAWFVTPDMF